MSEMNVRVLVFAAAREVVGTSELALTLAVGATAGDALDALCARWPGLAPYAGSLRLAVNGDYVGREWGLVAGDPVAGG
jgi:molybdopterin synthase catalytic subunit/molybdopterin synthase sulfur carrier subunit